MPLIHLTRAATSISRAPGRFSATSLPVRFTTTRTISSTQTFRYASKQAMDKDSLNPVSSEYSKSGGDNSAAHSDEAFDPSKTTPESQKQSSENSPGDDPLQVSPSNHEVSKPRPAQEGGAQRSEAEAKGQRGPSSGAGSPEKAGGGKSGGGGSGGNA